VTYTYNVTNTGDTSLIVSLTDNTFPSPIFTGQVLAAGASNITMVSHVLIANTTNIATATGVDQNGTSVNAQATAFVQVIHPAISLTKTADPSTPQIAPANFTYTYVVTNTGDVALIGVTIYDQTFNQLILGPVPLSVGQSATGTWGPVTYPNVTASYTNYANATGTDQNGTVVHAFAQATVYLYVPPPTGGYLWSVNGVMVLLAAIEDALVSNYWGPVLAVGAIAALIIFKRRRN
jgi:archaellum component FlaG (FlaF/FlaG flagellin family)